MSISDPYYTAWCYTCKHWEAVDGLDQGICHHDPTNPQLAIKRGYCWKHELETKDDETP